MNGCKVCGGDKYVNLTIDGCRVSLPGFASAHKMRFEVCLGCGMVKINQGLHGNIKEYVQGMEREI